MKLSSQIWFYIAAGPSPEIQNSSYYKVARSLLQSTKIWETLLAGSMLFTSTRLKDSLLALAECWSDSTQFSSDTFILFYVQRKNKNLFCFRSFIQHSAHLNILNSFKKLFFFHISNSVLKCFKLDVFYKKTFFIQIMDILWFQ